MTRTRKPTATETAQAALLDAARQLVSAEQEATGKVTLELSTHDVTVLSLTLQHELESHKLSAQDPDNFTWTNAEGAGRACWHLLGRIHPEAQKSWTKYNGEPCSWRHTMCVAFYPQANALLCANCGKPTSRHPKSVIRSYEAQQQEVDA